jgi:hypothetical protein
MVEVAKKSQKFSQRKSNEVLWKMVVLRNVSRRHTQQYLYATAGLGPNEVTNENVVERSWNIPVGKTHVAARRSAANFTR